MDEYIEREKVVFGILGLTIVDSAVAAYADAVLHRVQSIPAADVAPVRHGRWVNEQMIVGGFAETWACDCSVCGRTQREPLWKPSY